MRGQRIGDGVDEVRLRSVAGQVVERKDASESIREALRPYSVPTAATTATSSAAAIHVDAGSGLLPGPKRGAGAEGSIGGTCAAVAGMRSSAVTGAMKR